MERQGCYTVIYNSQIAEQAGIWEEEGDMLLLFRDLGEEIAFITEDIQKKLGISALAFNENTPVCARTRNGNLHGDDARLRSLRIDVFGCYSWKASLIYAISCEKKCETCSSR